MRPPFAVCVRCLLLVASITAQHHRKHSNIPQDGSFRSIEQLVTHKQHLTIEHGIGRPLHGPGAHAPSWAVDAAGSFHSQAGQDLSVVAILANKTGGFFVDLAANDPIFLSNTRALERDFDWSGVCIDANQKMLEKLVVQRACRVIKAVVSAESGQTVRFTRPAEQPSSSSSAASADGSGSGGATPPAATPEGRPNAMPNAYLEGRAKLEAGVAGILDSNMDNKEQRSGWVVEEYTTTTLAQVLTHVEAPSVIDYLSLDIEGAEYLAMKSFDFSKWRFQVLTVERPEAKLRQLLRDNGYRYVKDHGCFGDQLWVHNTIATQAAAALGIKLPDASVDQEGAQRCKDAASRPKEGTGTPFWG